MLAPAAIPRDGGEKVFEAIGVTLEYETSAGITRAVEDVSLSARAGERLVLLGASGCGKSSLLKAVAGFIKPVKGRILVRGKEVKNPGPDRIVVFQEFDQLLPWKTVLENVAFPLRTARGFSRKDAREKAKLALRKVGLERALNAYPHTLSGGMKQRTAIARALVTEPDVLLMDEPFAALDALTRRQLQEDLLALAKDLQFTLLFVTHAIDEAIMIGTKLHLLSPHPGRTISVFNLDHASIGQPGSKEFELLTKKVHDLLFSKQHERIAEHV